MTDNRASLQKQLNAYRRNLRILEEQLAHYGGEMNAPVHIINQIRTAKEEIARLEDELKRLDSPPTEQPPPAKDKPASAPPEIEGETFTIQGVKHKALPPGYILHNSFEIETFLAHGGMGAIYRGRQVRTKRAVAIKENFIATPEGVEQFRREGEILVKLDKHPHLPYVHDFFVVNGRQYLVMEFIEGEDLSDILKDEAGNRAPLPEATAVDYIEQVCRAARYLHERPEPVIHRDIKPKNIKITPQGKAVLVDFGLAKVGGAKTETEFGAQGISPGFAPPEQYNDRSRTGPASDIYALGATLYALLTATRPPDSMDILLGEESLTPPAEINPALSDSVCQAVEWAMKIHKKDRPQSVAEWVETLPPP